MVMTFENMGWGVTWEKTYMVPVFGKKDGVIQ